MVGTVETPGEHLTQMDAWHYNISMFFLSFHYNFHGKDILSHCRMPALKKALPLNLVLPKQIPQRTDILNALNDCTSCRWESSAYVYFNEGYPLKGGAMLNDPVKGLIIIDMTECGKVAGIEFVNEIEGPDSEPLSENKGNWHLKSLAPGNPGTSKINFNPAGFPLWKNDK